jgi:AcrR family transcriptional regulator
MNTEIENILHRVFTLYQKYGIKSITMDDIAKELGISKKTLYEYFIDKNDLVEKVYEYENTSKTQCFVELTKDSENAIQQLFTATKFINESLKNFNPTVDFDLKKYHFEVFEARQKSMVENMTYHLLANLNRGIKEKLYRAELNPELIARLHVSRIVSMFNSEIFSKDEIINAENHRELMIYHIRGIATEAGIKVLEKELKND